MKKITFFTILLFASLFSYADYTDTVSTSQNDLSFFTISGYNVASLTNGFYTEEIGAPQLPVKILSFVIPIDQKVSSITINSTTVQQLSGTYNIYPVQTPVFTNMSPNSLPFDDPNPAIYNSTNPYPGMLYEIVNDGYPMGYHVVTIKFYPVEYIPASGILNLYTNINFTIVYENNTENVLRSNKQSTYSDNLSKGYLKSILANPNDLNSVAGGAREVVGNGTSSNLRGMSPVSLTNIPDYIIITDSSFVSSFQVLADWKTQKGVFAMVVSIDDIYSNYQGYDNAEKIRNYLKDVFINFGSGKYILLGGDIDIVPTRIAPFSGGNFETDFYYATIQRDWNANGNNIFGESADSTDMSPVFFVGRAPINNSTKANNFVSKVMGYEKLDSTANKNYVQNLSFWCADGSANCGDYPSGINRLNTIDDSSTGYINPQNYYVLKLYDHYSSHIGESQYTDRYFQLNSSNVKNSMNTGWASFGKTWGNTHLIYHCDHSGFDAMGTSSECSNDNISRSDMDSLTNGYYYQILYSDGCEPNEFSLDAISEHYINNPNGGGVAFIGNTGPGIWGDDTKFEYYFCRALYDLTKPDAYENYYYHIGYLNQYSASPQLNDSWRLRNRNLLGDPEMMVWTCTPTNLSVSSLNYSSANKQITGTVSGLTYNLTSHVIVTVCAWKGTEIYSKQDIDATTASINFTLTNVLADTPGNITVTVTAHNFIPNISNYNVSSISGAHPYMTSYTIDDDNNGSSSGNSDAFPDAGETIELPVVITNSGNTTATNVTATLSWTADTSYQTQSGQNATVTIGTSSGNFGNILAGQTVNNNSAPFVFTINKDAFENITPRPLTQFISFTLSISVNGTVFSAKSFDVQIDEPNLTKGENTVAWSSSNQLIVKLYNKGLGQAVFDVSSNATLTTNDSTITITNGISIYNNIDGVNSTTNNGSNTSPFTFTISGGTYNDETFNLAVTDKYGKTWTYSNFKLSQPVIIDSSSSISHYGYQTSIELYWTIITSASVQGYNLYRSSNSNGTYTKVNNDIIPYTCYLDENLSQLTPYYYKLTVVDINGNESAAYPTTPTNYYLASTSLDLHNGWPVIPTSSGGDITGKAEGSPVVYDLFGDGYKEIFFTTGDGGKGGVWAFNHDASRWYSFDGNPTDKNGYINLECYTSATPAIGDIDNVGTFELAVTTRIYSISGIPVPNSQKLLTYNTPAVQNTAPTYQSTFPVSISGWEINKGPVFSDIDGDGKLEILLCNQSDNSSYVGGGVKIYNEGGTADSGWANTTGYNCGFGMPVAFDFNNDGKKEIVIGCTGSYSRPAGGVFIFNEDGSDYITGKNPVYTPDSGYRCDFPPVVADIDNDETYEIIFISAQYTIVVPCLRTDFL